MATIEQVIADLTDFVNADIGKGTLHIESVYLALQALRKLAAYEDTGLSPAEVAKLAQANRWVPIDERMPDSCGLKVLLTATNAFNQMSVFSGFTGYMEHGKMEFHSNERDKDISKWHVTHWMPLPKPPISKGGKREWID